MTVKRYDFGTERRGNTGLPGIVGKVDGRYVLYEDYLALKADRQRRGEPVGRFTGRFVMDPDGSKALFVVEAYGAIPGPGAELFSAPQTAEPEKEPSDSEIFNLCEDFCGMTLEDLDVAGFARALLARYGNKSCDTQSTF